MAAHVRCIEVFVRTHTVHAARDGARRPVPRALDQAAAKSEILRTGGRAKWPEELRNFALLRISCRMESAAASSSPFLSALSISLWCFAFQSVFGEGVEK